MVKKKKKISPVHLYGFLHLCILPYARHECLRNLSAFAQFFDRRIGRTISSARTKVVPLSGPRDLSVELREYGEVVMTPIGDALTVFAISYSVKSFTFYLRLSINRLKNNKKAAGTAE